MSEQNTYINCISIYPYIESEYVFYGILQEIYYNKEILNSKGEIIEK